MDRNQEFIGSNLRKRLLRLFWADFKVFQLMISHTALLSFLHSLQKQFIDLLLAIKIQVTCSYKLICISSEMPWAGKQRICLGSPSV